MIWIKKNGPVEPEVRSQARGLPVNIFDMLLLQIPMTQGVQHMRSKTTMESFLDW